MVQTRRPPRAIALAALLLASLGLAVGAAAQTSVDDGYTTAPTAVLTVAAPGVLGNDGVEGAVIVFTVNGAAFEVSTTVTLPSGAVLTMRDDGSFDYDPTEIEEPAPASDSFVYTNLETSHQLESPAATVTIDLGGGPPPSATAADDHYLVMEGALLDVPAPGILGNDSAASGALTVHSVDGVVPEFPYPVAVAHGSVDVYQDGRIRFQHDGTPSGGGQDGENVVDTFTYTATNGAGESNTATVTIEPTPAGTGGTVLNAFFDRLEIVVSDGEIGNSGTARLTLAAAAGSAVAISYPGSTEGANVLVLRNSSQSFTQDAREVLGSCERLALVAQARPDRYDLHVRVESTLASPFSGGGDPSQDGAVTAEVASSRVGCDLRRAAAGSP